MTTCLFAPLLQCRLYLDRQVRYLPEIPENPVSLMHQPRILHLERLPCTPLLPITVFVMTNMMTSDDKLLLLLPFFLNKVEATPMNGSSVHVSFD